MTQKPYMKEFLEKEYFLKTEYTEYLEIESLEWIENIPEDVKQKSVFIITTRGQKTRTVNARDYDYNVMKIINEYSKDGWKVVTFTDTFVYRNRGSSFTPKIDMLQRRKCYLLSRNYEEYTDR